MGLKWLQLDLAGTKRVKFWKLHDVSFWASVPFASPKHSASYQLLHLHVLIFYCWQKFHMDVNAGWICMVKIMASLPLSLFWSVPLCLCYSFGVSVLIFYNLLLLCSVRFPLLFSLSSLTFSRPQTSLVEKHVERIHSLESALRQRESSLHKLNTQLHNKDMQYLQLHSPDPHSKSCFVCTHADVHLEIAQWSRTCRSVLKLPLLTHSYTGRSLYK